MVSMLPSEATSTTGIKRYTLTEQIVEWLSTRIITGEYRPNTPLTEVELAETIGCSRSPLREALRVLAQEGLVDLVPGKGATVSPLEPKLAADLYDTRALLEPAAARLAVAVITGADLARLRDAYAELRLAADNQDVTRYQGLNWSFHSDLYSLCPNSTIVDLIRLTWRRSLRYGQLLRSNRDRPRGSVVRKARLMEAIEARDADGAAEHVAAIIMSGRSDVLEALTKRPDDPYSYWEKSELAAG